MFIFNNNFKKQLGIKFQKDDGTGTGNTEDSTNDIINDIIQESLKDEKDKNTKNEASEKEEIEENEEDLVEEQNENEEESEEKYSNEELKNMLIKERENRAFKKRGLTDKQILLVKKFSKESEINGLVKNLKKDIDLKDVDILINTVKEIFPEVFENKENKVVKKKTVGKGLNVSNSKKDNKVEDSIFEKIIANRLR